MEGEFPFIRKLRENNSIIVYIMFKHFGSISKFVIIFLLLALIGHMYDKYKKKVKDSEIVEHSDIIKKYLLNDDALLGSKPIVWVYIDYETNSRNWASFGSRNTTNLNQPYQLMTLKSIIKQVGTEFNICLIDDDSFAKLLPSWSINLNKLASPIKEYMKNMGVMNLLHKYGGIVIPSSYLALKNIHNLYNFGVNKHDCFIIESKNKNISSTRLDTYPDKLFMGCKKNSESIKELLEYMQILNSTDFTMEQEFIGKVENKCAELINKNKMCLIDGKLIGTVTNDGKKVLIDDLLQESYIDFSENLQGILIPDKEILRRTKYQWFARMSPDQILSSNIILAKYMLLSL